MQSIHCTVMITHAQFADIGQTRCKTTNIYASVMHKIKCISADNSIYIMTVILYHNRGRQMEHVLSIIVKKDIQ